MAELNIKKQFYNEKGELETLKIYTTQTEVGTPYKKLTLNIDGENIIGYIGLTDEIDTPKVSSNKVIIDGKEYRERKYVGIKNFSQYMKTTYPDTYQTLQYLPEDFPDTSDGTSFSGCFTGCNELLEIDDRLDTRNASSLGAYFINIPKLEKIPVLDLRNFTNISYVFAISGILNIECKNTENISNYQSMCQNDTRLISVKGFNTARCTNFKLIFYNCASLKDIMPIDLSSMSVETINATNMGNMLYNCQALTSITFNNVPKGITEEQLRTATGAPSSCQIIINYRKSKEHTPIRIIKAENMKLVDIDINGDMSIIREGNRPLDEYIVNSGDWGTIYDDGKDFRCFITKDNLIYCGQAYNSTTRKDTQPEIPDGIEIPNGKIVLEKGHFNSTEDFSFVQHNASTIERGQESIYRCLPLYYDNLNYTEKFYSELFIQPEENQSNFDYFGSRYFNSFRKDSNFKTSNFKLNKDFNRIGIANASSSSSLMNRFQQSFSQINFYEGQLFAEELENELSKIKTKVLSVARDETNQDPALEFSIKEGVL